MPVSDFLLVLAAIFVLAKLFGEIAERLGQPAVLGELVAGVLLGSSALGMVDQGQDALHLLAELGVVILLFEIGLETDLKRLLGVGREAGTVAVVGVLIPFSLGFLVARALGVGTLPSVVAGAALTATSVGITARVLSDLGRLDAPEGQVVLGAAVIDDVLGLVILAVVTGLVAGNGVQLATIVWTTASAFGFLAVAVALGRVMARKLFDMLAAVSREHTLGVLGLAVALLFAVAAERAGSALIVGAFAAGLALGETRQAPAIRSGVVRVGHFFVPIFFVWVGAAVDVGAFGRAGVLVLGIALVLVGIAGKVLAGFAPWWFRGRKLVVGVAMVPRGEVGLIFAQMGLSAGVLDGGQYAAVMFMVIVTTLATPPALKALLGPNDRVGPAGPIGISDLTTEA